MKKSLAHLPQAKADEVKLIAEKIRSLAKDVQMVILFGSYWPRRLQRRPAIPGQRPPLNTKSHKKRSGEPGTESNSWNNLRPASKNYTK